MKYGELIDASIEVLPVQETHTDTYFNKVYSIPPLHI